MNKKLFFLCLIFLIGIILRFYRLGEVPLGFHRDEAFLGYNAYSVLKTGNDMSGNFMPLHLQSFIYSPAGYSYFSIPFIYLLGLSAFSVRFASAFFASLSIIVCFFLCLEIFRNNKDRYLISLASTFLFSISPWNINLARTATESSIVVFFISLGSLLLLMGIRRKQIVLQIISFIFFAITLFVYQAPRAFLPLFLPIIFIIYLDKNRDIKNKLIIGLIFILFILLPTLSILSSKELSLRIRTLSVFSDTYTTAVLRENISADGVEKVPTIFTRAFHNKLTSYSSEITKNYFKHFSFDFLFTDSGFPDRYRVPSMGLLYIFELPLIIFGIYKIVRDKSRDGFLILPWILLAPVGAALTFDDIPNLQRTLLIFPALSILEGVGVVCFLNLTRKLKLRSLIYLLSLVVILYSFFFYIHQYYIHVNRYRTWYRQEGYQQLVTKVNSLLSNYKTVVIANTQSAPTVFFLFYSSYDPALFQKQTSISDKNVSDSVNFYNYRFVSEECPSESKKIEVLYKNQENILYVDDGNCKLPSLSDVLDTIYRHDGSVAFRILKKKSQ